MRWPWRKKAAACSPSSPCEGTKAREQAATNLAAAEARWPEVHRVAGSLRELRERNHFGASVALIFRDDKGVRR